MKIEYPEIDVEEDNASDLRSNVSIEPVGSEFRSNVSIEPGTSTPNHGMVHPDGVYNLWTTKATTCLISQYKKYRSMVGQSPMFRSLRDMFDMISVEMQKNGFYFSPQKCENKWRVLERKYKNLVIRERMKKPGRIKHYGHWEHKKAFDEIFNEKRKSVYLQESEYPPVGNSTKYALILPKPMNVPSQAASDTNEESRIQAEEVEQMGDLIRPCKPSGTFLNVRRTESLVESPKKQLPTPSLNSLIIDLKHLMAESEKNKERRHLEKMELRRKELEVQEKLLKIKEQKLELEKHKILAMAQSLKVNL